MGSSRVWLFGCLALLSPVLVAQNCADGDCDDDGINDALEAALAERFAPEWRFNRYHPGDGSSQNNNEKNYPISVEKWFEQEAADGEPPEVVFEFSVPQPVNPTTQIQPPALNFRETRTMQDIRELHEMTNPFNGEFVTSENLIDDEYHREISVYIDGFPRDLLGDPDGFPTYFHCYEKGDAVFISYMLFYAYNEKAMPFDLADHRGDWKGVFIKLHGIGAGPLDDPALASDASVGIDYIWYGGHGEKKFIEPTSPLYLSNGDHPRVFVSRGSHTCWPRPGEWHNYDVDNSEIYGSVGGALVALVSSFLNILAGGFLGIFGGYGVEDMIDDADDMFRGDGLVVESWLGGRQLINLGESTHNDTLSNGDPDPDIQGIPLTGWGDFIGKMGCDFMGGEADSPGPPYSKGEWRAGITSSNVYEWSQLVTLNPSYLEPFTPVNTAMSAGWHATSGSPQVIIWGGEKFDGEPWVISGPGVFPDISELVYTEVGGQPYYRGLSVLFAGRLRIKLYPGYNFEGSPVTVTRSKHKVSGVFHSMVIEDYVTGETCDMMVDAAATGPEDGSAINPFNTVQEAVNALQGNGYICIQAGSYPEALDFSGPMHLRAQGGVVHLGQ